MRKEVGRILRFAQDRVLMLRTKLLRIFALRVSPALREAATDLRGLMVMSLIIGLAIFV